MSSAKEIIKRIVSSGGSKYRIAKLCEVSWQTVHMWSREVFQPKESNLKKLKEAEAELKK